jgi:arginase family enzyme
MTLDQFRRTLTDAAPPQSLTAPLRALWFDAHGDWNQAHSVAQDVEDATGAWVHAYLHRKEGDLQNAEYWYRRAGKPVATSALDDEWAAMVTLLLSRVDD